MRVKAHIRLLQRRYQECIRLCELTVYLAKKYKFDLKCVNKCLLITALAFQGKGD